MKKYAQQYVLLFIGFMAMMLSACEKTDLGPDYTDKGFVYFKGQGSFAQMVPTPATASTGTATFSGVYDNSLQIMNYSLKWDGLSSGVTRADFIFPSSQVQNGLLVRNMITAATPRLTTDSITGALWTVNSLTPQELIDLKAGKVYYTISTTANTGGEIRGQVILK